MDEALMLARRKAATPREKFELVLLEARAGNSGLLYVSNDEQINNAAKAGYRMTLNVDLGDVILIEKAEGPIKGAFVGVCSEISPNTCKALIIDKLESNIDEKTKTVDLLKSDKLIVWYRKGVPV